MRGEEGATHPIVVRPSLDIGRAETLLDQVAAVAWDELYHAYGPASDVPGQIAAVLVGDDETRAEAWWNLWGNIHHQGTIYEATVPAVPILLGIAGWSDHPDRAEALMMLREIGAACGAHVWRYGAHGDPVSDEDEQRRLHPELRNRLVAGAASMLDSWRSEPPDVRRALLWLLSVHTDLRAEHQDLVDEVLPAVHRRAWELELAGSMDSDAVFALEEWVRRGDDS